MISTVWLQIALYPASWELAAACASLITKCDVPLEDQLEVSTNYQNTILQGVYRTVKNLVVPQISNILVADET